MDAGKMIWLEFDGWYIDEDGNRVLFDTTDEKKAEDGGIKKEGRVYGPMPMIVGETSLIEGLKDAVTGASVEEEKEVEIPPEKGFGERDPTNIMMVPMNKLLRLPQFRKDDSPPPAVGMEVDFGERKGTIVYMTSARARVDFNPKYAGRTLVYRFKVVKEAKELEDYVFGAIEIAYGRKDGFEVERKDDGLHIKIPDFAKIDQVWLFQKLRVISLIRKYTDEKVIKFIEEYVKREEAASDKESKGEDAGAESEEKSEEAEGEGKGEEESKG